MKLYNSSLENFVLPLGDAVLGTRFISTLRQWRKIQAFSESELSSLQGKKLDRILQHAVCHIPYYRNKLLNPRNGRLTLQDFPIMTKQEMRANQEALLWHPLKQHKLVCERSSGSSGVQGQVFMSKEEQSGVQALQILLWEWAGYRIGSPILQTGMTLNRGMVKGIKDWLFKTTYQSAFGLEESQILTVLQALRHSKSEFFGGYASSLYLYAKVAEKHGIEDIHFRSVISWGDKMFSHYRSLIERQFSTSVYDTYGATEGFMIAGQKDLQYYYILTPHVYIELLDNKGNEVQDGELGHVVVTSLDAYEMPLIRYYLGDLAVKLPREKYPSKRDYKFPLLERIIGRDTDIIRTPSGKNMIVHFFTAIFEHIPEIKQFKVIQETPHEMLIQFIRGSNFDVTVLKKVETKIHESLGEVFPIRFNEVSAILPSPSGKPQIVVSTLKHA